MRINLNLGFSHFDGTVIRRPGDEKDLTSKTVCVEALLGSYQDERLDAGQKLLRFNLARRVFNAKNEIDLTTEEVALVKNLVAKMFSVLITGQVWEQMDK